MIPVSLRDLPHLGSKPSNLDNKIIGSFVNLPIMANCSLKDRLA